MQASGDSIGAKLLEWYDRHARSLPWRAPPGSAPADPYRVWLSEIMLQQTTVAHAAPYFVRFTERWPTVAALAAADEAEVMSAWAGLGYYSRARNLIACARRVTERGGFPETEAELRRLPGIGDYTAAAVAAIAFSRETVPVDANVERVVARLFAIGEPWPRARAAIRTAAQTIAPRSRHGDFAQALMDLGASICTVRQPKCLACSVNGDCRAFASGDPDAFPVKAAKRPKPLRRGRAYWIVREGNVWLVRRPAKGMLGGMRALPDDGWSVRRDGSSRNAGKRLGVVRHGFTHFDLELEVAVINAPPSPGGEWWPLARLGEAGLPTLYVKAARLALDDAAADAQADDGDDQHDQAEVAAAVR